VNHVTVPNKGVTLFLIYNSTFMLRFCAGSILHILLVLAVISFLT